ncbi:MAG: hypothetical protein SAK29_33325 [Scytonema sp. PMC 1069.18]|nr:hypothetical protein [Scytonema sp. PMC 1069.18]MEC4880600.1 hypothetical protein [Scytonema sp. PMC 1070.18]
MYDSTVTCAIAQVIRLTECDTVPYTPTRIIVTTRLNWRSHNSFLRRNFNSKAMLRR